jgi:hypothetical protein
MAQHMTIMQTKNTVLKKIKEAIKKDFHNSSGMRTSSRYPYNPELSQQYGVADVDVYLVERKIGESFIYGTDRGLFEIHFNRAEKLVKEIYLIA